MAKYRQIFLQFWLVMIILLAAVPLTISANSSPAVLLVDDDDHPDVRGYYTAALDELGLLYAL